MKMHFALIVAVILLNGTAETSFSQKTSVDLTFTAFDKTAYIRLDSIKVMNKTQGDSVKIYWPDTTLTYELTPGDLLLFIGYAMVFPMGVQSINEGGQQFRLFQNYPNPVNDQARISIYMPLKGMVNLMVADVRGRIVVNFDQKLEKGTHTFHFYPGVERIYFLAARWNRITQSIKVITEGRTGGKTCKLEYAGFDHQIPSLKQSPRIGGLVVQESGILDTPDNDTAYTFQFATNIPCPGTPTVTYEGQVYNTIQIFSQCWLKENLNVGTMIPGAKEMSDNDTIEKYCYNNEPDSCTKYGGFYQWNEMMQYTTQPGTQGICPPGWHLPTDEEWKVLEGAVDSQFGIGDSEWDLHSQFRGFDAGFNLKTNSGWLGNGNGIDLFGFSGLPAGKRLDDGEFGLNKACGLWWSSNVINIFYAWSRIADYSSQRMERGWYVGHNYGQSVRCLRDY